MSRSKTRKQEDLEPIERQLAALVRLMAISAARSFVATSSVPNQDEEVKNDVPNADDRA